MSESLYDAVGGKDVIRSVVQDFYQMVYYDQQLQAYFAETDMDTLRDHQTEFLCLVTDGPTEYSGREMGAAHADLDVSKQDFDLVVSYLDRALSQNDISAANRERIISRVTAYEDAIVDQ